MAKRVLMAAATVLALGVFGVSAASAATLTVCESGPPKCGYSSIQSAINAAKSGDTIEIARGTYNEHLEIPGSGTATKLTLQGGSAGKTIIDGTNNGTVVTISSGESAAINGVTITEGFAINGGGIRNDGTLTVSNSTVSGNSALNGGIYNEGTLTVNNSTITSNDGGKFGGGIFNLGTATVNNTTISHNSAVRGGGGIASDGKLTLSNSAVSNNTVDERGGGIDTEGTTILNNSAVRNNSSNEAGGGIANDHGGTLTLNNSAISGNKADEGGGIFNEEAVNGSNDSITGNTPNGIVNENGGTTNLKNSKVQSP